MGKAYIQGKHRSLKVFRLLLGFACIGWTQSNVHCESSGRKLGCRAQSAIGDWNFIVGLWGFLLCAESLHGAGHFGGILLHSDLGESTQQDISACFFIEYSIVCSEFVQGFSQSPLWNCRCASTLLANSDLFDCASSSRSRWSGDFSLAIFQDGIFWRDGIEKQKATLICGEEAVSRMAFVLILLLQSDTRLSA